METPLNPPADPPLTIPKLASEDGDLDSQTRLLESIPSTENWDPLPSPPSHQVLVTQPTEDDSEGQTLGAQLVDAGVNEAEAEQTEHASTDTPPDE